MRKTLLGGGRYLFYKLYIVVSWHPVASAPIGRWEVALDRYLRFFLAGEVGFEPTNAAVKALCLARLGDSPILVAVWRTAERKHLGCFSLLERHLKHQKSVYC